jgi:uncharacterized protein
MALRIPSLYIAPSPLGGRGVFTAVAIEPESLIEVCPVIVIPAKDVATIHDTCLHDYYFLWGDEEAAIALGFGSLYNHARRPNADYHMDPDQLTIDIYCIRPIAAGEEITINYTDENDPRTRLWFEER